MLLSSPAPLLAGIEWWPPVRWGPCSPSTLLVELLGDWLALPFTLLDHCRTFFLYLGTGREPFRQEVIVILERAKDTNKAYIFISVKKFGGKIGVGQAETWLGWGEEQRG